MASPNIILPNDFALSKINYGQVKKLDNGGKSIYIKYGGDPLIMQLPEMSAPFGLSKWTGDGKTKYTLDLSFAGKDQRPVLQKFFDNIGGLDKKLITDAIENSPTWFNKKYSSFEVVEALYTPMLKYAKDKATGEITDKYPATFKMNMPLSKDGSSFDCEVYDAKCNRMDIMALEEKGGIKGARVSAIVQCLGIWIAGSKFGCSWKVIQMQVSPRAAISGFAIRSIPDDKPATTPDDEEDADGADIHEHAEPDAATPVAVAAGDDDDIIESDDDLDAKPAPAAPAPAAAKTVAKRVVKK